jgi:hypothetical protein
MKLNDNYYTGREVQKLLGITEPKLRTLVANKQLTKYYPPGRQTAVYLKSEVNEFAEKWTAFLMAKEAPKTTFHIAMLDDMEEEYKLAKRALGQTMSIETRKSWLEKNPLCDYIVKYGNKIVAYLTLLPVKHETIMSFLNGEIRGWQITPDDIELFEPGKDLECIIIGIASDPDTNEDTRTHYMLTLIRGIMREMQKLGQKGVTITKLYATSETPTGIAMALHLGMQEITPRLGKRLRFILDIEQSDSPLIQIYKKNSSREERTKP